MDQNIEKHALIRGVECEAVTFFGDRHIAAKLRSFDFYRIKKCIGVRTRCWETPIYLADISWLPCDIEKYHEL